jgi:amidase
MACHPCLALKKMRLQSHFPSSHHLAMNVPCAKSDGLPVGMMLIGRHFEEDAVLRAAHAFEKAGIYA